MRVIVRSGGEIKKEKEADCLLQRPLYHLRLSYLQLRISIVQGRNAMLKKKKAAGIPVGANRL